MNNFEQLCQHLIQEMNWIDELNALLIQEKEAMMANQFDALEPLSEKKEVLSSLLEQSAQNRIALVNSGSTLSNNPNDSLKQFLEQCSTEEALKLQKLNKDLAERLVKCRELNAVNGQIITYNLNSRKELLNIMSGKTGSASELYTATGQMDDAHLTRHHEKA